MFKPIVALVATSSTLVLVGCAANGGGPAAKHPDSFENYNRRMHGFNSKLYKRVIHPIGQGVDFILPEFVEESVSSIFENLEVPGTMINNLSQGKPKSAGQDLLRFCINTTLGIAGIFDWASRWGVPKHEEDLGQTLGKYGMAPGPYIVLPVVGGVTPRDLIGSIADPTLLLNSDDYTAVESVGLFVGLAHAADTSEIPPYDEQREFYYDFRHCSIMDGSAEAATSCQNICTAFSVMMESELDSVNEDPSDPERTEMEARMQNFLPGYCRSQDIETEVES